MREPGFEDLVDLWQDSEEGNREAFEALARRARRKGRLLAYADFALVLLLLGGLVPGILMAPNPMTIAAAILLLIATLWLSWTRRRYRQMSAALNTSDPASFLESSVANVMANLRRVNLSLVLIAPLLVMVALFKGSQRSRGGIETLPQGIVEWLGSPKTWAGLIIVALIVLAMIRSRRRLREELGRLESLRLDYERERLRDAGIE